MSPNATVDATGNSLVTPATKLTITAIRATPISIPMSYAYKWGPGTFEGFTRTLVEVETAEGLVGLGECGTSRDARIINESLTPRLIGANALNLADCESRAIPSYTGMITGRDFSRLNAYAGIEMALWDLAGKLTGRSVAELLGGRVRDQVAFTEYFALEKPTAEGIAAVVQACTDAVSQHGAKAFEGKVGVLSLRQEAGMVAAIRDVVGSDVPIRLDANMGWDVPTAREALRIYAELGVTWVEEPVRTQSELLRLRSQTTISFSSHQVDLPQAARDGAPDAFVIKIPYLGGIRRTVEFVMACSLLGIQVWFRAPSTGVATAAELQVAAALQPINQPSQNLSRWVADDIVEGGPFHATEGVVAVPQGPGLGVTLDPDAVARCAERARTAPLNDPYFH